MKLILFVDCMVICYIKLILQFLKIKKVPIILDPVLKSSKFNNSNKNRPVLIYLLFLRLFKKFKSIYDFENYENCKN